MAFKLLPPSQGLLGSKAAAVGIGALTGGPAGAALALAGANNQAIGKISGAAKVVGGIGASPAPAPAAATDQSPIGRRLETLKADPQASLYDGLDALKDPSVPDYVRQAYLEPFMRAKHFGGKGVG